MRTKVDKGEGGSILTNILQTSFMDDPLLLDKHITSLSDKCFFHLQRI